SEVRRCRYIGKTPKLIRQHTATGKLMPMAQKPLRKTLVFSPHCKTNNGIMYPCSKRARCQVGLTVMSDHSPHCTVISIAQRWAESTIFGTRPGRTLPTQPTQGSQTMTMIN